MLSGIDQLGLFIAAGLLLNLSPGPDVVYIVSRAVRGGWRGGAVAALGITAGCFVHVAAATIGLSALVAASATAFTMLKWAGAAYLLYVGATMLLAKTRLGAIDPLAPVAGTLAQDASDNLRRVFLQGFWTNVLNPKVALFFLAFLPQFIRPDSPDKTLTFLLLGLIFNLNAVPVNLAYGLGAAWLSARFKAVQGAMAWIECAAGALFVYFGIRLAFTANPGH